VFLLAGAVKIKTVFMDVRFENNKPDVSLDIHLENGQILIIFLNKDETNARFIEFAENNYRGQPLNDGERIYWPDGPSLELDELINSLRYPGGKRVQKRRTTVTNAVTAAVALLFIVIAYTNVFSPSVAGVPMRDDPIPLAAPAGYTAELPVSGVNVGAGAADMELALSNPADGVNCLLFEIVVDGETLYESALADPGWKTDSVVLNKTLDKGEHTAVLNVYSYMSDNLAVTGCYSETFIITAN